MAPKPKKTAKFPAGERPKQLSSYAKVTKSAARAGLGLSGPETPRVIPAGEAARRANVIRNADKRIKNTSVAGSKTSTAYSPKPMSAAAKKKTAAAGKATGAKTKSKSLASKVGGVAGSVAKRAKTVAREVRDVKTALGTSLRDQEQNVRRAAMGVGPTKKNVGGNLKKQIKEVGSAIKSGKKGTSSDMYNKPGAYKSGTKRK
jgi:hypothetical protein